MFNLFRHGYSKKSRYLKSKKKSQLAQLLSKYNVSLMDYIQSFNGEM